MQAQRVQIRSFMPSNLVGTDQVAQAEGVGDDAGGHGGGGGGDGGLEAGGWDKSILLEGGGRGGLRGNEDNRMNKGGVEG